MTLQNLLKKVSARSLYILMVSIAASSALATSRMQPTSPNLTPSFGTTTSKFASTKPLVDAQITFEGVHFNQVVHVKIQPAVNLDQSRALAYNAKLLPAFSPYVTNADYKIVNNSDHQFWLSIGKRGVKSFTHMFHCSEESTKTSWRQYCEQDPTAPKGDKVVSAGKKDVHCENITAPNGSTSTDCTFEMAGNSRDVKVLWVSAKARELSYSLFSETVGYVAGLSLLMNGSSTSAQQAKQVLNNSADFKRLFSEISDAAEEASASTASPINYDFSTEAPQRFAYTPTTRL